MTIQIATSRIMLSRSHSNCHRERERCVIPFPIKYGRIFVQTRHVKAQSILPREREQVAHLLSQGGTDGVRT